MILYDFANDLEDVRVWGKIKRDADVHTPKDEIINIRLAGFSSHNGELILLGHAVRLNTPCYIRLGIVQVKAMFDGTEEKPELYNGKLWSYPLPRRLVT